MYVLIQTYKSHNSNRTENNKKLKKKICWCRRGQKAVTRLVIIIGRDLQTAGRSRQDPLTRGSEAEQLRAREHMVTARINNTRTQAH